MDGRGRDAVVRAVGSRAHGFCRHRWSAPEPARPVGCGPARGCDADAGVARERSAGHDGDRCRRLGKLCRRADARAGGRRARAGAGRGRDRRSGLPDADRPRLRSVGSRRRRARGGGAGRCVSDARSRRLPRGRGDPCHSAHAGCADAGGGRAAARRHAVAPRRGGTCAPGLGRRCRGRACLRLRPWRNRAARDMDAGAALRSRRAGAGRPAGAGRGFPA